MKLKLPIVATDRREGLFVLETNGYLFRGYDILRSGWESGNLNDHSLRSCIPSTTRGKYDSFTMSADWEASFV